MKRTEYTCSMDHFIPWIVRTASMFPDTIIYALALERWTKFQLDSFEKAVLECCLGTLAIWRSAQEFAVPAFLFENDVATRDAYKESGLCFRSATPEQPSSYFKSIVVTAPASDRLDNGDGKNMFYEIGFVTKELGERIARERRDPFAGTQVNILKDDMPVLSPYMTLSKDIIEKARYSVLNALQYDPENISNEILISEAVPVFYGWISEVMENRTKLPKLDHEKLKK